MKRLLDEPTDEVTRLLLRAAADHQPPRASKRRMLAALGFGSVIGLSTAEALAWFGTGTGKAALAATLLGASVGGVYFTSTRPSAVSTSASPARATLIEEGSASDDAVVAPAGPATPQVQQAAAPVREAEVPVQQANVPANAGGRDARRTSRPTAQRAIPSPAPPSSVEDSASAWHLSEEIGWVDRLRIAAERGDRAQFDALLTGYVERFPEPQLRLEVDRLAATVPPR